jgi:RNA polymerase sigma-70 factor, ECF subfamily
VNTDSRALFDVRLRACAEQLARGGNAALGELFDLTAARLLRYAQLMTRNSHDAEDVVQSAFVRAVLHADQLAAALHPWAYLIRMVRNEGLRFLKRRSVETLPPAEFSVEDEDWLLAAEASAEIRAALGELVPEQAEVVVLKLWEEMTFAEIADITGESPNTAASRYRYAIQKLRQRLKSLGEERAELATQGASSHGSGDREGVGTARPLTEVVSDRGGDRRRGLS